jgi:diketogulonate reductase-like aldo/keto reductase
MYSIAILEVLRSTPIFGTFRRSESEIYLALKKGYKILETSTGYSWQENESSPKIKTSILIKSAIEKYRNEGGIVPFIMTKFLPDDFIDLEGQFNLTPKATMHMNDLGQTPAIVLLHVPLDKEHGKEVEDPSNYEINTQAFQELMKLYPKQIKGVSNFNIARLEHLAHNDCRPKLISLEFNLRYQPTALISYCKSKHIILTAYRIFGKKGSLNDDEEIKEICLKFKMSLSDLSLGWARTQGITAITSSGKGASMEADLKSNSKSKKGAFVPNAIEILTNLNQGPTASTCMLEYCKHDVVDSKY